MPRDTAPETPKTIVKPRRKSVKSRLSRLREELKRRVNSYPALMRSADAVKMDERYMKWLHIKIKSGKEAADLWLVQKG